MTTETTEKPPRKPPKVVVPVRMSLAGKSTTRAVAEGIGIDYTALMRDAIAAEVKKRLADMPTAKRQTTLARAAEIEAEEAAKIAAKAKP